MTWWSEWTVNVFCVLVDWCKSGDPNKHRRSLRMCRWLTYCFKSHMDEVWIWKHCFLWRQLIEQILMNRDKNYCARGFFFSFFLAWSDSPLSKIWCLKLFGMWTLQVWKNTSFLPKRKQHQNLIVLSLFCQTIHGVHVSRNLFHLNNPCIQITPLSLCCKLYPKTHHLLHQSIGGLSNRQLTLKCIPWRLTDGSSYFQEFQLLRTSKGNDFNSIQMNLLLKRFIIFILTN